MRFAYTRHGPFEIEFRSQLFSWQAAFKLRICAAVSFNNLKSERHHWSTCATRAMSTSLNCSMVTPAAFSLGLGSTVAKIKVIYFKYSHLWSWWSEMNTARVLTACWRTQTRPALLLICVRCGDTAFNPFTYLTFPLFFCQLRSKRDDEKNKKLTPRKWLCCNKFIQMRAFCPSNCFPFLCVCSCLSLWLLFSIRPCMAT